MRHRPGSRLWAAAVLLLALNTRWELTPNAANAEAPTVASDEDGPTPLANQPLSEIGGTGIPILHVKEYIQDGGAGKEAKREPQRSHQRADGEGEDGAFAPDRSVASTESGRPVAPLFIALDDVVNPDVGSQASGAAATAAGEGAWLGEGLGQERQAAGAVEGSHIQVIASQSAGMTCICFPTADDGASDPSEVAALAPPSMFPDDQCHLDLQDMMDFLCQFNAGVHCRHAAGSDWLQPQLTQQPPPQPQPPLLAPPDEYRKVVQQAAAGAQQPSAAAVSADADAAAEAPVRTPEEAPEAAVVEVEKAREGSVAAGTPAEGVKDGDEHALDSEDEFRVNFAFSKDGAKVVAANKEAKKAGRALDERMDTFLKNDCKADKWLILELSQRISVTAFELSMMEMYSSRVRDVQLKARQTHPREDLAREHLKDAAANYPAFFAAPEWEDLGSFATVNKKGSQLFPLLRPAWARFLLFRFLSHHGNEDVCALNSIKVFGKTEAQDLEDQLRRIESLELGDDAPAPAPAPPPLPPPASGNASSASAEQGLAEEARSEAGSTQVARDAGDAAEATPRLPTTEAAAPEAEEGPAVLERLALSVRSAIAGLTAATAGEGMRTPPIPAQAARLLPQGDRPAGGGATAESDALSSIAPEPDAADAAAPGSTDVAAPTAHPAGGQELPLALREQPAPAPPQEDAGGGSQPDREATLVVQPQAEVPAGGVAGGGAPVQAVAESVAAAALCESGEGDACAQAGPLPPEGVPDVPGGVHTEPAQPLAPAAPLDDGDSAAAAEPTAPAAATALSPPPPPPPPPLAGVDAGGEGVGAGPAGAAGEGGARAGVSLEGARPGKVGSVYDKIKSELYSLKLNQTVVWRYMQDLHSNVSRAMTELQSKQAAAAAQARQLAEGFDALDMAVAELTEQQLSLVQKWGSERERAAAEDAEHDELLRSLALQVKTLEIELAQARRRSTGLMLLAATPLGLLCLQIPKLSKSSPAVALVLLLSAANGALGVVLGLDLPLPVPLVAGFNHVLCW